MSKYYGESARLVKDLYSEARKERSIVFIDEFEELASRKDSDSHEATRKIINQLLAELDGVNDNKNVYTIGATNSPMSIEPAVLRRLRPLFIRLPDEKTRAKIVSKTTGGHAVDAEYIAHLTESKTIGNVQYFFSCDDLVELIGQASRMKWRETRNSKCKIATEDVRGAYERFIPSINEFDMGRYQDITKLSTQKKATA